jgi:hypothetical protein
VRRAAAAAALVALASVVARAGDDLGEDHAFVEIVASKETCWLGETIDLKLRVGYDAAFFRDHAVQMFAQKLDVPLRVEAPWLRRPVGATVRDGAVASSGLSFALDDDVVFATPAADATRDGRVFRVIESTKRCTPSAAGDLQVRAPTLRFAYASTFEDDFVHGRMPVDRREAVIIGRSPTIHVRALPAAGRPPEFAGAIGKFTIAAEAAPRDVAVGDTFKLTLTVRGDGTSVSAPHPADLGGLHVYGEIEKTRGAFEYDVAALRDDVTSVPPIAFAFFDPDAGQYRVVKTDAIPLRVRESPTNARAEPTRDDDSRASRWPVVVAVVVALAFFGVFVRRRMRARAAEDVGGGHVREAAAAFRARAPDADALAAFLAACLHCPTAAVISPDLASRLVAAGAPSDVAKRAASLLERLVAARYGGDASPDDAAAARAVVDEVEARWSVADSRRVGEN